MSFSVLLITPPLVQINTPYPATAYLKGFLDSKGIHASQVDLGLELILKVFSEEGMQHIQRYIDAAELEAQTDILESIVYQNWDTYVHTIDHVVAFLQNKNTTLAYAIANRQFLPEGPRFDVLNETIHMFGSGIMDKAKHIASLYIEDINDFITAYVDEHFGLSRYAEQISMSAHSFDGLYEELLRPASVIMQMCHDILREKIAAFSPSLIAFSIPFPGNLFSALSCARFVRTVFPDIHLVAGGGYPNTELRQINDARFFEFFDFLTLDDGEKPIECLVHYLSADKTKANLKRTFLLDESGAVTYCDNPLLKDYTFSALPAPSYAGLKINDYLSIIDVVNPMHRLWSDGRWNKMTLAHGCYWAKCTFCDISLNYISDYHHADASKIVDDIESVIAETGHTGFHFVDEAAPPALMRDVALELMRRGIKITWWTNIRFEKSFTYDLCQLLAASGCIAVSGGLEVASDRLLQLIKKGVTVQQVAQVCDHFQRNGILVHAYLMYGFPTQTEQETIDALEMVRQLFGADVLESAYWHKFTMTIHSPCGQVPEKFGVSALPAYEGAAPFANNDITHADPGGAEHDKYTDGLNTALYNYLHKKCLDWDVREWFDFKVPAAAVGAHYIKNVLKDKPEVKFLPHKKLVWLGNYPQGNHVHHEDGMVSIKIFNRHRFIELTIDADYGDFLFSFLQKCHYSNADIPGIGEHIASFESIFDDNFVDFMTEDIYPGLNKLGLVCF